MDIIEYLIKFNFYRNNNFIIKFSKRILEFQQEFLNSSGHLLGGGYSSLESGIPYTHFLIQMVILF